MQEDFRYADLLDDDVFKLVFGQESSKEVMIEFLNQVIDDRNIVDLEFMDKEMRSMDREKKNSVYDMFCKTDDGSRIVVEVQRRKQKSYVERTIYYSTFQVRNQVDAGSGDYSFCPVYVINILDFNINENKGIPDVKTVYRLYQENRHTLLTDRLTFIFIELNKFNKGLSELNGNILDGIYFCLKNMSIMKECPKELDYGVFRKMFNMSELVNMDEVTRSKVLLKMTTERDLRNQMEYARQEAIEEGRATGHAAGLAAGLAAGHAEGKAEATLDNARKLKALGVDASIISQATGLDIKEIENL